MGLLNKFGLKTNLDIDNEKVTGGPNRDNAANVPGGIYKNIKSGNIYGFYQSGGGTLKDKDGKEIKNILHQYLPKNTYLNSKNWEK